MSLPLPAHYFTGAASDPASEPMHPAVLQHLLQQQQAMQQVLQMQMQAAGAVAPTSLAGLGGYSPAAAPPPPLYAGAPLMQQQPPQQTAVSLPVIGPAARSDSASSTSVSSAENTQTASSPSTSQSTGEQKDVVRLHISNIPYKWRDPDLRKLFETHGEVVEAEVIFNDRGSKGFGFVTMASKEGADAAKAAIHEQQFDGRVVEVNAATARMSGRQKAKVLQSQLQNPHLQLAMLHQQQPLLPPTAALGSADPLQQLLAAQAILAQYSAQQQMLQGLQGLPGMQPIQPMQPSLQQQQQQWLMQQQMGMGILPPAPPQYDQRKMAEEMAKQRYRPY